MSKPFVSIGIDISKAFLDMHGLKVEHPARIANDADGIARLIGWIGERMPDVIVCEPSGGYERPLIAALRKAALPIALVNARQVRDFARASGILAKTDALDARVLADYGTAFRPRPKQAPRDVTLAQYVQRRRQLVDALGCEMRQREHLTEADLLRGSDDHVAWLQDHIAETEARIRESIAADPAMEERHAILTSCKGVGDVTAATLIAEMPELGNASHTQITALAGLAPFNRDSGTLRGTRHIRGGRASIRHALYMATISAIRYNPDIRTLYQRLRARGKHAKVAIVACMHQLIITLNSLLRDNRKWKPVYANTPA